MAKNSNNVLAIGVGLNLDPLNKDIQDAANTAKTGMETVGNAIVGGSAKSGESVQKAADKVQTLRTQLRQATNDAQQMAQKFGVMSAQALASAAKAGELKDEIGDMNTVITAFSADSKFTVVAGALQQAAGAASIVTGAMGLLGTESKETQEMLLKVQSALALTQGLASIKEMGAAFTALNAVIVGQVIPSITAMGTATILATGGLIVAVVAVTAAIISYNNTLDAETKAHLDAAEAAKQQAAAEANLTSIVQTTNALRTAAMKDGIAKDKQLLQDKINADLNAQWESYQKGEIALLTYNTRVALIKQAGYNELEKINKKYQIKELQDAAKHQLQLQTVYANPIEIQNQFTGGQSNLPALTAPTAPTKTGLNESETMAFKIKQETDKAREAILNASIVLAEAQQKLFDNLQKITEQGLNSVFGNIGQALGNTIAQGIQGQNTDMFGALRDALLISIADMAVSVGSALVAAGVALAIDPLTSSMTGAYTKIAAGTALIAAGSLAKGLIKGGGSTSSSPTSSGSGSIAQSSFSNQGQFKSFGGNMNNAIEIEGVVRGNNIELVNRRNMSKVNRSLIL